MRLLEKRLLKLGIAWGLVIGLVSVLTGTFLGARWWMRNWKLITELLGLGLGIAYTVNYAGEIRKAKLIKLLIAKYGVFVYLVVLIWLVWMLLVWGISGGDKGQGIIELLQGVGYIQDNQWHWGSWLVSSVWLGLKLVAFGLVVVLGYWWLAKRYKGRKA